LLIEQPDEVSNKLFYVFFVPSPPPSDYISSSSIH